MTEQAEARQSAHPFDQEFKELTTRALLETFNSPFLHPARTVQENRVYAGIGLADLSDVKVTKVNSERSYLEVEFTGKYEAEGEVKVTYVKEHTKVMDVIMDYLFNLR